MIIYSLSLGARAKAKAGARARAGARTGARARAWSKRTNLLFILNLRLCQVL